MVYGTIITLRDIAVCEHETGMHKYIHINLFIVRFTKKYLYCDYCKELVLIKKFWQLR